MNLHSLKRWHWVAVGLVAGLALGLGKLWAASNQPVGGEGFISKADFERDPRLPPVGGKPLLIAIVVHPSTTDVDMVSFGQLDAESQYQSKRLAAPRPYAPGRAGYSVRDYLREASAANPAIKAGYAWWDIPAAGITLWAAGGAIVIGGIWPVLLGFLVGAGLGRKDPEYDLDRFHREPSAPKVEPSTADQQRLAELEAEMAAGLSKSPPASSETALEPAIPRSPRELSASCVEAAPAGDGEPDHQYGGEYYPVEKKAPHGFTLIELLVVIGIIAILMSLLMPAMRAARQQAQTVQCASNLRQVGMALQSYVNANKGWLPAWSDWHTWPAGQSEDSDGPAWMLELTPYIGPPDSRVYNCPAFPSDTPMRNYFLAAKWSGLNGRHAMKLSDVTMSSRFVLCGDKTQRGLYPAPFGTSSHEQDDADPDDFSADGAPIMAWPWDEGGSYMHRGGNNVLFDDIHVALFSSYDPTAMTFNPHRMQDWKDVTADLSPETRATP